MDTLGYIDLYCERTGPDFWNEPVNALSNSAFLVAALVAWSMVQRRGGRDAAETGLIFLAGLIGVGSFLFHTFAQPWSEMADVIPIWTFVGCLIVVILVRMLRHNPARLARVLAIVAVSVGASFWVFSGDTTTDTDIGVGPLNGSLQYLPALIALAGFAMVTTLRRHPARGLVAAAAGSFCLALVFRTIDLRVCAATGIGTHFLWHLLNGLMLGLLLLALIRHLPPKASHSTPRG